MPDRYPDDLFEQIRQLTARVEQLEAQLRQRPALTAASQGWLMADMSVPSVPTGHIHIGCASEDFFVATPSGTVKTLFAQAPATATQGPLETDVTAPGSYSSTWGQRVRTDLVSTRATAFAIQDSLRSVGIMAL